MFEFREEVRVKQTVIAPALKGRTGIVLARPTDRLRILGPSPTGKDMWEVRNHNHEQCPPVSTFHASELYSV